jgi:pimeloyl-ACP methyl ester carboxylesterase
MAHTFVLVHGGWLGGWCWRRVADRLRERGHVVFTPTLTGLGERSHLLSAGIDLDTHIADVVNVVKWERLNDVVLCGHSFSGFVISGVAEQIAPAIRSIVFLDAFVPSDGDSIQGLAGDAIRDGVRGAMQRGSAGVLPRSAETLGVNEADRAWVDGLCVRQPIRTLTSPIALKGARERIARKIYIRAKGYNNHAFDRAFAAAQSDQTWRCYQMPCGDDDHGRYAGTSRRAFAASRGLKRSNRSDPSRLMRGRRSTSQVRYSCIAALASPPRS